MIKQEWKHLLRNPILLIVLVAIIFIPTIYTTLFLGSMWDPYGKLEQLPVAVVNEDQPVEYNDTQLTVGANLVDSLKESTALSFDFVDAKTAQEGLENGDYYMVITIPSDFSKNASTLMDEEPVQMELQYATNPAKNYIASKMSESALEKIRVAVSDEVTKTYAQTMFDSIAEAGDGMGDAADGASQIADGTKDLADGNETIRTNLETLASSTITFSDGSETLEKGLKSYVAGVEQVQDGAVSLKSGAKELYDGSATLKDGIATLNTGITTLADGTMQLNDSTGTLTAGVDSLLKGANALKDGTVTLKDGLTTYTDGTDSLADGVIAYVAGEKKLAAGAKQLSGLSKLGDVYTGINQLYTSVAVGTKEQTSLAAGTKALAEGTKSLADGASTLSSGLNEMYTTVEKMVDNFSESNLGKMAAKLQEAKAGLGQISGGVTEQIVPGINQVKAAVNTVSDGLNNADAVVSQVAAGAQAVNAQADAAIQAIEDSVAAGAISQDTADTLIASLQASKVELPESVTTQMTQLQTALQGGVQALEKGAQLLETGAQTLDKGAAVVAAVEEQLPNISTDTFETLLAGLDQLNTGAKTVAGGAATVNTNMQTVSAGTQKVADGLKTLNTATEKFPEAGEGVDALLKGFDTLSANNSALKKGAKALKKASPTLNKGMSDVTTGAKKLATGGKTLATGAKKLAAGITAVDDGAQALKSGGVKLSDGSKTLNSGLNTLYTGTVTLNDGLTTLVSNDKTLLSGSKQLSEGASAIGDGAQKLADGSQELGDGIDKLEDGSKELADKLGEGKETLDDVEATDATLDMFATPVVSEETKITDMENNGHAMSAYMMSVALWVGCLAFCLMYPLTEYKGKLKNGFAWWASKASILFPLSMGMGVLMLAMLHIFNGFNPVDWGRTIVVTCLASLAFMAIMYFFNVWLGKVGSFIMLIFMVVQLAGAAGTYPIEISGDFVASINKWLPFTYTVNAFRDTISGSGDITPAVLVLCGLIVVFTLLTVMMFQIRAVRLKKQKPLLYNLIEKAGLA